MGYITYFSGELKIEPPLTKPILEYIKGINTIRQDVQNKKKDSLKTR